MLLAAIWWALLAFGGCMVGSIGFWWLLYCGLYRLLGSCEALVQFCRCFQMGWIVPKFYQCKREFLTRGGHDPKKKSQLNFNEKYEIHFSDAIWKYTSTYLINVSFNHTFRNLKLSSIEIFD